MRKYSLFLIISFLSVTGDHLAGDLTLLTAGKPGGGCSLGIGLSHRSGVKFRNELEKLALTHRTPLRRQGTFGRAEEEDVGIEKAGHTLLELRTLYCGLCINSIGSRLVLHEDRYL